MLEFFLNRRSPPARTLTSPAPSREELRTLLTAAARSPDHGKLEPWRFVVISDGALPRLALEIERIGKSQGLEPLKMAKQKAALNDAQLIVAVIGSPRESAKIPYREQVLSTGAVCLALLNSALASGWGANWLTGIGAYDRDFRRNFLGMAEQEFVAGFVHLGTARFTPRDRPRPDVDAITTWLDV